MNFRHEWKHEITSADKMVLIQRLSAVMTLDSHAKGGIYHIRSLYFDDLNDTALYEKLDGVNMRDKYRLRYYNGDTSHIVLERKSKINGLCCKKSVPISLSVASRHREREPPGIPGYRWSKMPERKEFLHRVG